MVDTLASSPRYKSSRNSFREDHVRALLSGSAYVMVCLESGFG